MFREDVNQKSLGMTPAMYAARIIEWSFVPIDKKCANLNMKVIKFLNGTLCWISNAA